MIAPFPGNEEERLKEVARHAVLDTLPEEAFDRITRLAARLLRVPIAAVTLVDRGRQWFKSSYGLTITETSRDASFCAHAILGDSTMIVSDARRDERFVDNELVTGDPGIRFYAGVPMQSADGMKLGTLCAIDTEPREFTVEETAILEDLAAIASNEMRLRLAIRERAQLSTAIRYLQSGVVVSDPNLTDAPLVFVNPEFLAMTGYTEADVIGRNCRFLQGPETDQNDLNEIRQAIRRRETFQKVLLNYRKDGTPFWNELTVSPVFGPEGQLLNFVGLQTDITERKRLNDEVNRSYEKLRAAEALRDNLTSMLVHDLRAPLTAVGGFLELLQMDASGKLSDQENQFIAIARDGAEKLQEMVTSMLDVTRLEAGEMPVQRTLCDLREVISASLAPLQSLSLKCNLTTNLPPEPIPAELDSNLIQRVMTNLVSNAVKFTPAGGDIRITVAEEGAFARVSIADSGPGIPAEFHARIFDKFGQIEGHKNRHSTGLGLTFCKLAIEAHGGSIGLESVVGNGTTFWFILPKRGNLVA